MDAIDEIEFFENDVNVIDAGGGDDTFKVLKELRDSTIQNSLNFIIPTNKDLPVVYNLKKTINYILENFENPNIYLFLNFATKNTKNEIKKEFGNIFGDKEYEIEGLINLYRDEIKKFGYVTNSYLFQILDLQKTSFVDFLKESRYFSTEDLIDLKNNFFEKVQKGEMSKEEAFQKFRESKKTYRLYTKAKELKDLLYTLNDEFLKEFNNGINNE
jgi:hypothetical protein